jgi:hypothetical protein
MALLCPHVDSKTIRLLYRWCSGELIRYLIMQAQPIMHNFAQLMLDGSNYTLLWNQHIPLISNPQEV